ncbi:MAG: magnesium transporter CorA family protein [Candidatus Cloacimonadota bacterium]|nr:magnesium transporter CorA family protein [Candidatus Cloacimonadota bacterium]
MIEVYKAIDNKLTKIGVEKIAEKDSWIYIVSPTSEEIENITKKFNVPKDFLEDPLDYNESPRIEIEDGVTLIIIQTPYYDEDDEYIKFKTLPLGIIFTKECLITVSSKKDDVLQNFIRGRVKKFSTSKRNRLTLQILSKTSTVYLNYLKRISKITNDIEYRLEKSMKNDELMDFLDLQKSLVYFTTSLRANEAVMEKLYRIGLLTKFEEDKDYLEDMMVDNKQALEMTNIHSNILRSTMDAFASMISNNLNAVMKFLTSVTIILMIPTLIASIYGMNIKLPFARSSHAFAITIGASIVFSLIGVFIFIKRKWF